MYRIGLTTKEHHCDTIPPPTGFIVINAVSAGLLKRMTVTLAMFFLTEFKVTLYRDKCGFCGTTKEDDDCDADIFFFTELKIMFSRAK